MHVEAPDAENALELIEKLPGVGEEDGVTTSGMPSPPGGLHATSQSLLCG